MDFKFRWNMFMTSFLPLWISIFIADLFEIFTSLKEVWNDKESFFNNLSEVAKVNKVSLGVIIAVSILMISSFISINRFIKYHQGAKQKPKAKIVEVKRANKLTSEFLLAYILPMIAFDFTELKSVILFLIYYGMLAYLCIRNNNVYTNILLEFKKYKMYTCTLETKKMGKNATYDDCLVISKNDLITQKDNDIEYWDFDNYIYIDLR